MVGRSEMQNNGKMKINWWKLDKGEMKEEFKKKVLQGLNTTKWKVVAEKFGWLLKKL